MGRFTSLILALLIALALAHGARADQIGPPPARELHGTWTLLKSGCTDLYDTPVPPGGTDTGGLGSTSSWNDVTEAYNLQANIGAPAQTSGSPDGLCDSEPWSIKGDITTGASQDLYIGPLNLPVDGGYLVSNYDTIGTNWAFVLVIPDPVPDAATDVLELERQATSTSLNSVMVLIGPGGDYSPAAILDSEAAVWPEAPLYLVLDWNGAASWVADIAIIPFRSNRFDARN